MRFETGIWRAAWDVLSLNWKTAAAAVLAATALDLLDEYMGGSYGFVVDLIIWSMVAISAHGTVLLGKTDFAFNNSQKIFWPFVWRSGLLLLLSIMPFMIAFFIFYHDVNFNVTLLKAMPVLGLTALVVFSLLGTWLPAVVVASDRRIGTAIGRAGKTFFYSAPRLVLGPGLIEIAALGLFMYSVTMVSGADAVPDTGGFSLPDLILWPIAYGVRAFSITLTAVILSRAYLIAEQAKGGAPVPAGGTDHQ